MTDNIPEWALEQARSTIDAYLDNAMPSIKQSAAWRDQDLYRAVARALASVAKAERERAAEIARKFGAYPAPGNDGFGTVVLREVNGHDIAAAILSDGGRDA